MPKRVAIPLAARTRPDRQRVPARLGAVIRACVLLASVSIGLSFAPSVAAAQTPTAYQVDATYKATIGLGLIGAELGLYLPTAFGYSETWSLITFPIVGAAGGAVGGYYIDRAGSPAASVSVLVVGLALAVPTVILTVGNTRYSTDDLEDDSRARLRVGRQMAGDGFLRRYNREWHLSMPGVGVNPMLRADANGDTTRYAEVRVTLMSGSF